MKILILLVSQISQTQFMRIIKFYEIMPWAWAWAMAWAGVPALGGLIWLMGCGHGTNDENNIMGQSFLMQDAWAGLVILGGRVANITNRPWNGQPS